MKVNLQLISKRAQAIYAKPESLKTGIAGDFEVELDQYDKILTAFHRKNSDNLDFLFAEVLVRITKNKNISEIWKINFREADSFLRDENHLPTFQESADEAALSFNKIKIELLAAAVKSQLENDFSEGEVLNLAAKNLWAQKLLRPLGWELVLYEDGVLTVTNTPENVSTESLELLINTILAGGEKVLPVKVVAV